MSRGQSDEKIAGNVGIGTAAPDYKLRVEGTLFMNNSLTDKITNTAWTNPSDIRLKNIKGPFDYGLDKLMQLNPIRYTFKADNPFGANSTDEHIGFIAQEVQKVIPEAAPSAALSAALRVRGEPEALAELR